MQLMRKLNNSFAFKGKLYFFGHVAESRIPTYGNLCLSLLWFAHPPFPGDIIEGQAAKPPLCSYVFFFLIYFLFNYSANEVDGGS